MMRPGACRTNEFRVAKNAACGPPNPSGTPKRCELPTTTSAPISPGGTSSVNAMFITDSNRPVDKTSWISFDRLEFETASANLKPASQEQVRNVAAILKAYPAAMIKIGGYTDNTGDPNANQRLSQSRAENTRHAIESQGISSSRLDAEGYGDQHPVASNTSDEGRQRNRRVDILVTHK